ncbi:unnamed protein product [Eruca vesicaria subsp. sativa]|uniref:F-box domain-containing protein n=1 Tax=Eruca vesicaria subsp. sativa TaxID=29727 RepID=A0ABC8LWJ4_ERUVS|nr:unnamed protein product [Eruca vesicaria subsp. sativa]
MKTKETEDKDNEGVISTVDYSLDSFPLDLTMDILLKLPAKSLLVCKSVSKKWCSIIRSQIFIDTFLSVSISRPLFLFTYQHYSWNDNYDNQLIILSSPHHISHPESNDSSSLVPRHEMAMSKTSPDRYIIHSCVRGFIYCSHHHHYMVCNPTTRQVISLPEDHRFDHDTVKYYMHLGYDLSNDKYKVLRMVVTQPWRDNLVSEHSVYTLERQQSSNVPWRRVESGISNYTPCSKGVYINGVVYYEGRTTSSMILVTFDFDSERFGQIKQPEETLTCLADYKGKLAGLSFLNETSFRLLVLEDVKEQIWSKTDIFYFPDTFWHLEETFSGTTDAGELVFGGNSYADGLYVSFFDIKTKVMRRVEIEGFTDDDELRWWRISSWTN